MIDSTTLGAAIAVAKASGSSESQQAAIDAINAKIPNQASPSNQLADKDFVNSSINSSAAFFRGSFSTKFGLLSHSWQSSDPTEEYYVTNNDYCYVEDDESHNHEAWRYIYVNEAGGQSNGWQAQFKINDTPLTSSQVASLNSGATSEIIDSIGNKVDKVSGKGLSTEDYTTAEKTKLAEIEPGAQVNTVTGVKGNAEANYRTGNINISKGDIGLSEVDNTSDMDKPVSTAQRAALDLKQDALTFDTLPMEDSTNPVTSGGVYAALVNNLDPLLPSIINADNYVSLMKRWFSLNGAAALTDFSALCERWYTITRTGWTGGTRFYHWPENGASDGTKVGDNAGMVAEASTDSVAGQDDYQDVPLFHCLDCNWILDENGKPHITAIEGVCGNFERYNPDKLVGVIQMTGWHKYVDDAENGTFTHMYTDVIGADGYKPLPEAIDLDGTYRSWVAHAKYAAGDDYGCYSGVHPWTYTASHNTAITNFRNKLGSQYGGKTSADDAFLKLMFFLKYASLTADGILQGCVNYNYQYRVAVEETGVERVILTAAQAANIKVGSCVMVGNPTAFSSGTTLSIDRGQAGMRAKVDRKLVTRKETLSDGNVAIYIDNGGTLFDTTANTITNPGDSPTYISTSPWYTGTCDNVKGVDGSPTTPGTGAEPCILQGIEYALGAYEVVSDCILKYYQDSNSKYHLTVYVCREASKYATSIDANYSLVDYEVDCPASSSWQYISEHGYDITHQDVWFPHLIGCTSSQRTRDALYILATSTSSYEWLSLGSLHYGVGSAGLSIVRADHGLSYSAWDILARLSATGTRGELAA